MKLALSKKGLGLMIIIGLGILFSSIMLIISTPPLKLEGPIGIKQYDILTTNEKLESAQEYMNTALSYSAQAAQDKLFRTSGLETEESALGPNFLSPCGVHIYPLYRSRSSSCLPEFRQTYKSYLEQNMDYYLDAYTALPLTFTTIYSLTSNSDETTSIKGEAFSFSASLDSKASLTKQEKKTYPRGALGGYGNEQQTTCSTGDCLATVATYYYELYTLAGFSFPYVQGGESPYSFEDTKKDQEENENSIFKGVELTRLQPGTGKFTQAGFDASGWLWWVGYHASISQLLVRRDLNTYYQSLIAGEEIICAQNRQGTQTCDRLTVIDKAQPGDLLFVEEGGAPSDVMIYLGDNMVIHSRGGYGLIKEEIPTKYLYSGTSHILAVIRLRYPPAQENALFDTPRNTALEGMEEETSLLPQENCILAIDLSQVNEEGVRASRRGIFDDPATAMDAFNKLLVETGQDQTILDAASRFPKIPPELIKATMMTEIGYGDLARSYLEGTTTSREGASIIGPMQISEDACDSVNRAYGKICDYDLIKKGGFEGAANGILTGTAYLDRLPAVSEYISNQNPDYYFLTIAYNAGPTSAARIQEATSARKQIDVADVQWRDVTLEDVENGMKQIKGDWAHEKAKWEEIYEYPNLVGLSLSQQCQGDIFAYYRTTSSDISFNPVVNTKQDIDLTAMEQVKDFTQLVLGCDNNLPSCVEDAVNYFNEKHSPFITLSLQGEKDSAAYELIDQMMNCYANDQTNCLCTFDITNDENEYALGPNPQVNTLSPSALLQVGVIGSSSTENADQAGGYVYYLNQKNVATFDAYGISGDTTGKLLARFDRDIISKNYDEVIIFNGINDWGVPLSTPEKNLQAMYTKAHQAGIRVIAVTVQPSKAWFDAAQDSNPSLYDPDAIAEKMNALNNWILHTAKDVDVRVDVYSLLEDPQRPDYLKPDYSRDGLHMSSLGHQVLANAIYEAAYGEYTQGSSTVQADTGLSLTGDETLLSLDNSGIVELGTFNKESFSLSSSEKIALLPFAPADRSGDSSTEPLFVLLDPLTGKHQLIRKNSDTWIVGTTTDKLALAKEGDFSPSSVERNARQQLIINYAEQYLGTGYGDITDCSASAAQAGICTTQCGSFVSNVFLYTLGKVFGSNIVPRGDGYEKCDNSNVKKYDTINALDEKTKERLASELQPGDIFSSTGSTTNGHTGIYVGRGTVKDSARDRDDGSAYCYKTFVEDPDGDLVFIHSVGPVCYNTLTQLVEEQNRNKMSFCRHTLLESNVDPDEFTTLKQTANTENIASSLQWVPYDEETQAIYQCRDNKQYFRFQATFQFTDETFGFSIYLNDTVAPPDATQQAVFSRTCLAQPIAILSWQTLPESEPIYSFDLYLQNESASQLPITLIESTAKEITAQQDPTELSVLHQLYKEEFDGGSITYYYLINSFADQPLQSGQSYEFDIVPTDDFLNKGEPSTEYYSFTIPESLADSVSSALGTDILVDVVNPFLLGECTDANEFSIEDYLSRFSNSLAGPVAEVTS
ncbi:MAG: C40 family peptidase [Nanoarchaeota archaeon]|nr:C40 family peptidase [Nanoarchaeota archaeon]